MKAEILGKILKDILFLSETKVATDFKEGEFVEGRILKKLENYLLINIKNRGILKAYSKVPLKSNKLLLEVVKTLPQPELKIISELPEDIEFDNLKTVKAFNTNNIFKSFKSSKLAKNILIHGSDISDVNTLKDKLKKLPEKLGLTYEREILKEKQPSESIKKEAFKHKNMELMNFIEGFQKISSENLMFFPLFFENVKNFKKGTVGFKKNPLKKNFYSVLIDLELSNDTFIQTLIISENKNLHIVFSSNKDEFIKFLKSEIDSLKKAIANISDYTIINTSFKIINKLESLNEVINFFQLNNSTFIDFKT